MKSRALSVILIVAMLLPLCACQDSSVDTPTQPSEQESTAATFETQPSDPTEISDPTDATEPSDETAPTETLIPTDTTDATEAPTETPTETPTAPTVLPTEKPTEAPTAPPTQAPTTATTPTETVHVHNWIDATYQRPRHCSTCFKTQGSSLKRPQIRDFGGVTVSIAIATVGETNLDDEWFYKEIERLFGCNISVSRIHPDYYYLKTSEWLSSENPPTIMKINGLIEDCIALGESGKFIDVMAPENLEKMPNFKSIFIDNKINNEILLQTSAEDGSHYILPSYDVQNIESYWYYNETVFKEAGVQWNGDRDGFLNMLRRLKKYAPDSYPLTGSKFHETLNYVISSFGANSTYAAYDWDKDEWFFGASSDASYEMLRMYQTAYNEGLMNPDMLTQGSGIMVDDLKDQKSFVCHTSLLWANFLGEAIAYGDFTCGRLIPAFAPVGTNGMNYQVSDFSNTCGTVISTKDPKAAECAMAILDWLYDTSEEGGAWLNTVGTDFMLKTDENGRLNWIDESNRVTGINNTPEYVGGLYGVLQAPLDLRVHPDSPYYNSCETVAMAHEIGKELDYFRAAPSLPKMNSSLTAQYQKAQAAINQMQLDFITENWTRAQFDAWAADFNATYGNVIDYLNG